MAAAPSNAGAMDMDSFEAELEATMDAMVGEEGEASGAPNTEAGWRTPPSPGLRLAAATDFLWDPMAADFLPELLLPHTHYAPCLRSDVEVLGACTWDSGLLTVPPDGYCLIYSYLAACNPQHWAAMIRSDEGFIRDRAMERALLLQAKDILARIVQSMRKEGAVAQADRLEAGGYPGDEEMHFYAREFGCAVLVVPTDADAIPIICGDGPVGMEVEHTFGRGAGGAAGHFVLARSWLPQPRQEEPPQAPSVVKRRLRGKQDATAAYGPPPAKKPTKVAAQPARHPLQACVKKPRRKRPATKRGPSDFCGGSSAGPCCFSTANIGEPARRHAGRQQCMFCCQDVLSMALATARGRGNVSRCLKIYHAAQATDPAVLEKALACIQICSPGSVEGFRTKAAEKKRGQTKKRPAGSSTGRPLKEAWQLCLQRRFAVTKPPSAAERKKYRATVLADQRRAKKRFFPEAPRRERGAAADLEATVDNADALPQAGLSDAALGLQRWCEEGSWGMCPACHVLQPRPLQPNDLRKDAKPEVAASFCRRCKAKYPHLVPDPSEAPEPLRNLSPASIEALRPLDIDVGAEVRAPAGYRKKVRMITFSWALQSVDAKVGALPKEDKRAAKRALRYLKAAEHNEYRHFYELHLQFLRRYEEPTPAQAKRPLHFIEETGLENALWPHLYWNLQMCESHERLSDKRLDQLDQKRKRPRRADPAPEHEDSSASSAEDASGDEGAEQAGERRRSIKKSFQCKLLSPLLGYGSDFALLQYVYDLHLWTDLGSKKGQSAGETSMRIMMSGHPMSPMYWTDIKHGLFDLVRQLGYPDLYWTLAPYEFSYPYSTFLLDEMQKTLRGRLNLPAFEAMHLAHTMMQVCRNFVAGESITAKGQGWKENLLSNKMEGQFGANCLNFFARLEFQDGSKKAGTQRYHGSGRPHVHALFWVKDMEAAKLEEVVSATAVLPEGQEALAAYVRGSQLDRHGDSRWPIHEAPSQFDAEEEKLHLRHTEEDAAEGVRGYFPDVMGALKCHQDLQMTQGRGLLLLYVAKYVAKWSDSSYDEWMSDAASATSLCRKVLFEYHPLEPEMILQLTGATFRQWAFGSAMGGRRSVRAPRPSNAEQPVSVQAYMESPWRREDMSLLEFLRKTGSDGAGNIAGWLRQAHRAVCRQAEEAGETPPTLEDFANDYTMQGEQLVAAEYLWRLNDGYFGQWCMMHWPFRSLSVFDVAAAREVVPPRYRWLATALFLTDDVAIAPPHLRGYWRKPSNLERDMRLEGWTDAGMQDVKDFVAAQILAIDRYVSGQLDRSEELAAEAAGRGAERPRDAEHRFEGKQALLHKQVAQRAALARAAHAAASAEEGDALRDEAREGRHRPLVCSGRPGTGKSTVLHRNVRETLAAGGSVCVALPTARLATRMAEKLGSHERLVVDTFTAAFQLHKPAAEGMYCMYGYDLVVVDEFSQLGRADFERILHCWHAADCLPALVFLGDKYQLPGVDEERPWESTAWKSTDLRFVELTEVFRCDDPAFLETLQLLRTAMPTETQLNAICRGHKAWLGEDPTAKAIGKLLREHPEATMVAATKQGVARINALALEALHPRAAPLATILGAFEDNPDNYVKGKLRTDRRPIPADVPVHRNVRIYLTRNVRKADDYINGMGCTVKSWDAGRQILWVQTDTGKRLPVTRWRDPDHHGLVYFPVRLGYCTTVHKVQGDEFPFIIVYLDTPNMPAVGYTALSRVRNSCSYLLGGLITPEHFAPVTMR